METYQFKQVLMWCSYASSVILCVHPYCPCSFLCNEFVLLVIGCFLLLESVWSLVLSELSVSCCWAMLWWLMFGGVTLAHWVLFSVLAMLVQRQRCWVCRIGEMKQWQRICSRIKMKVWTSRKALEEGWLKYFRINDIGEKTGYWLCFIFGCLFLVVLWWMSYCEWNVDRVRVFRG